METNSSTTNKISKFKFYYTYFTVTTIVYFYILSKLSLHQLFEVLLNKIIQNHTLSQEIAYFIASFFYYSFYFLLIESGMSLYTKYLAYKKKREITESFDGINSNSSFKEEIERRDREIEQLRSIANSSVNTGGYVTVDIPEERKAIFCDLLRGFEGYAELKGYKVSISIDASEEEKISFKIIVHEFGITTDRKIIKKDLDEYLERIKNGDFDSLPEILDPIEHSRLVMALKNRIVFLQQNYEVERNIREFYENFFERLPIQSISHASQPVLHITNTGSTEMDQRKYIANNAANVMQGDNHSNLFRTGNIQIGSTYREKKERVEKIDALLDELKKSGISGQQDAIRHIENVKEELADSENPDKSLIGKWLGKAGNILSVAEKGSALFLQAKSVFDSFGISL